MAQKLIIANWKMHFNTHQASLFLHKLQEKITHDRRVEVVLCPNFLTLQSLSLQVDHRKFKLGAQNCYFKDEGAFTGEVSATMLRGLVKYVLVGHSERRHIFGETNRDIACKVQAVVRNNMTPVLCVGETANEKTDGETKHVLHDQLVSGLSNVTSEEIEDMVIAYEPVWAIGNGDFAKAGDVAEVMLLIRKTIESLYGKAAAQKVRVLYGGSVDSHDAIEYLKLSDIDGLLIGGASLKAGSFSRIVEQAQDTSMTKTDN